MQVRFFGGLVVDDGETRVVAGRGQQALLLRLAIDAGTTVGYRALAEDVWPIDRPDDPRASLQSLASRLRRALPDGVLASAPGGYRLALDRTEVDITRFQDLVAAARRDDDPVSAARTARAALELWTGEPWTPEGDFDWLLRDLLEDRAHAERLARVSSPTAAPPVAIPAAITSLVGRDAELAAIADRLATDRLVTLIGTGGAGKTTLALETARSRAGAVIVVELAPAAPGDVWAAIAGSVGRSIRLAEASGTPLGAVDRVRDALVGREVLVVLDNCEHVSREAAEAAVALLEMSAGARVLATSREPLGVAGEAFVDLGPLPGVDAAELFARRVRAARGDAPHDDEQQTAARIVRRLDGLPLAIELAAAKARTLTLAEIDRGLDDRFALLAGGPRVGEARHRTLRALIDWSWDTLTESERIGLRAAAVFPDGIDAVDAPSVAARFEAAADAFDALVDRSLLTRREGRFRMLETVREYGLDRLRSEGLSAQFRRRQAETMADLATARDEIIRGPRVREALAWFDADEENLSAALRTCAEEGERIVGVRLVRALLWPWVLRERFEEVQHGLRAFADPRSVPASEAEVVVEAAALMLDAFAGMWDPDGDTDPPALDEMTQRRDTIAAAARQHPSDFASALVPLLDIAQALIRDTDGRAWSRDVRIDDAELADASAWTRALIATVRAGAAQNSGDVEELGRSTERALEGFRAIGDPWGEGFAGQLRSEWLMLAGRLEEALEVADRSTAALDGLSSTSDLLQQRALSVTLLLRLGRVDEARARTAEIAALAADDGSERALAQSEMNLATVELALGDGAAALAAIDRIDFGAQPRVPEQLLAWQDSKRAQALLLQGRPDDARAALRRAVPVAARTGDQPIISDVVLSIAGWLAATGRDAAAHDALALAAELRGVVDEHDPFRTWVHARTTATGEERIPPTVAVDATALLALLD